MTYKREEYKMEIEGSCKEVFITREAWHRMLAFAKIKPGTEIQGFGAVEETDDKLLINQIEIVEQEVSAGSCDTTKAQMAKSIHRLLTKFPDKNWICYWHSHGTMNCYPSGTDTDQIKDFLKCGLDKLITLVVNSREEVYARLDYAKPRIAFKKIRLFFDTELDESIAKAAAADYKKLVTSKFPIRYGHDYTPVSDTCHQKEHHLLSKTYDKGKFFWYHNDTSWCGPKNRGHIDTGIQDPVAAAQNETTVDGDPPGADSSDLYSPREIVNLGKRIAGQFKGQLDNIGAIFCDPETTTLREYIIKVRCDSALSKRSKNQLINLLNLHGVLIMEDAVNTLFQPEAN